VTADLVCFAPHPDDAELGCGGRLWLARARGLKTAVVDLTRGELGTRGTPEIRAREAEAASAVLGLAERHNLGFPDGGVVFDEERRRAVVRVLRELRPAIVLFPYDVDPHPDHAHAARLVREALYHAALRRFEPAAGPPHQVKTALAYLGRVVFEPDVIVDVTETAGEKLRAIRCYASQFHSEGSTEPETALSARGFLPAQEARWRHFGSLIGADFGEPYHAGAPRAVRDPRDLL
jgi:bacillithiol biosynthesis deacetylase BshB1